MKIIGGDGEHNVIRLIGELDAGNVSMVKAHLDDQLDRPGELVLDLSQLTYMGSEGVHLFVGIAKRRQSTGPLVLANPLQHVRRVLEITGLDQLPNIEIQ